jgi:hypothetical protein
LKNFFFKIHLLHLLRAHKSFCQAGARRVGALKTGVNKRTLRNQQGSVGQGRPDLFGVVGSYWRVAVQSANTDASSLQSYILTEKIVNVAPLVENLLGQLTPKAFAS